MLKYNNNFVSLNISPSSDTFLHIITFFDPIYSLFSQKFSVKTFNFPETLGTISRSGTWDKILGGGGQIGL